MTYGQRAELAQQLRDAALAYQRAEAFLAEVVEGERKAVALSCTGEFWQYQPESRRLRAWADAVERLPIE